MNKKELNELIGIRYKEDLKVADIMAKKFAKKQNNTKLTMVGLAQYIVVDASPKKLAKIHAEIKKLMRKILLNSRTESDIQKIEYFHMEE